MPKNGLIGIAGLFSALRFEGVGDMQMEPVSINKILTLTIYV